MQSLTMFSTLIPKIRVPREKKSTAAFGTFRTTQAVFSRFADVLYEGKEEFKHEGYYEDLNNVRFNNTKQPLNVYCFKELSSGRRANLN